jgi:hypothetical protein
MPSINGKPWKCDCGVTLGYMIKDGPYDCLKVCTMSPIQAIAIGEAKIYCPSCGSLRIWYPGAETIKEIIKNLMVAGVRLFPVDIPQK